MKKEILSLLKENKNDFISGQYISNRLSISRTAVWKYMNQLKDDGYEIESISKNGYKLISCPDILSLEEIQPYLNTKFIGRNIYYLDTIDSTNTYAKKLCEHGNINGAIIIAEEQTMGRGRLGRNFISPKYKGIWMSIILKPDLSPMDASKLTQTAAAAVVKSVLDLGIKAYVKWPNDIIVNHKKVCGILTEMNAELTKINYVIVGIGINVNIDSEDFPGDLNDIATSLKIETKKTISRKHFVASILNNFESLYSRFIENDDIESSIKICRENSAIIGKEILIINRDKTDSAKAIDIDMEGRLIVEYQNGNIEKLISGEVSIRRKTAYI